MTESPDSPPAAKKRPDEIARHWLASIKQAEEHYKAFFNRGDKITRRYRAELEQSESTGGAKFNLFWSNVQTLAPATYSRRPKVEVYRRFRDADPIGRLAAQILQRALQYEVDSGLDFHRALQSCVLDRLLPGQAVAWVRYEPSFAKQTVEEPDSSGMGVIQREVDVVKDEKTPVDYVFWKDVLFSPARGWADVRWGAKRVMFAKDALRKRFKESCAQFGGDVEKVSCNYDATQPDPESREKAAPDTDSSLKRALVWEIWDKESGQIIWVSPGYDFPLDLRDDPVGLENFFPFPPPMWATTTNDSLIPVADFVLYQGQLRELDVITARISLLTEALRVVGVYDASQTDLATLLQSGVENRMIPVNQWAAFAEKGGLKNVMDFVPIEQVVAVLQGLYEARETVKQTVYEITGMADIVRGATVASETLGAQQIKAKFANLRLSSRQQQVAEFASMILAIKADIMCFHYTPETLKRISSADQILESAQHPERVDAAIRLLKDERTRRYRIQVAEGSMIELDELGEQERRDKFMSSISNFLNAMKNVAAIGPEMIPVAFEMLKFVVRGFSTGRELEASIEDAAEQVKQRLAAPPPPPEPDPNEKLKAQVAQATQAEETKRTAMEIASKERIAGLEATMDERHLQVDTAVAAASADQAQEDSTISAQQGQQKMQLEGRKQQAAEAQAAVDSKIKQLESTDNKIIEQLTQLVQKVGRLKRSVPIYDPESGDILETREEYIQ
jgi:hypothetical protein